MEFKDLYKNLNKPKKFQEERRKELLEKQKLQRNQDQDSHRDLNDLNTSNDSTTSVSSTKPKRHVKSNKNYRNSLQISEWMHEKPDDLENWFILACPKGTRCLVVRSQQCTEAFYKDGGSIMKFKSNLSIGTVLDCVFDKLSQTIYVLDVLRYGNQELINCDVEFRFYWIKNKSVEDDWNSVGSNIKFELLTYHNVEETALVNTLLQRHPMWDQESTQLDGFLFYHKESLYVKGRTPLVLWLFPFMIDDFFDPSQYKVNPAYITKPDDYTTARMYMDEFDRLRMMKNHRRSKNSSLMDAEDSNCFDRTIEETMENDENQEFNAMRELELESE